MVDAENEVWKGVVGYEDLFSVSNKGRLFSLRTNKILKQNIVGEGYNACVTKLNGRKGSNLVLKVHREVAKAFIPNPDELPFVNHIDGDKLNHSVDNLEWVTPQGNVVHAIETGLLSLDHLKLISKENRKLTEEDVKYIRNNFKYGDRNFGARSLSRMFNIPHSTIMKIIRFERYAEV